MAYVFDVNGPNLIDEYLVWDIYEEDLLTTSEWVITDFPEIATITLMRSELRVAGSAATIAPAVGNKAGFASGGAGEDGRMLPAAANPRTGEDRRVTLLGRKLYGQSRPNIATGATGRVYTQITAVRGHR